MATQPFEFTPLDADLPSMAEAVEGDEVHRRFRRAKFAKSAQIVAGRFAELGLTVPSEGPDRWALDALMGTVLAQAHNKAERPLIITGVFTGQAAQVVLGIALELLARGIHAEAFVDGGESPNGAIVIYE